MRRTTSARARSVLAVAAVAMSATALLTAAPASAATPSYVALGDSYASGTGTASYLSDGTSCQRSLYAYPSLLASNKGYALTFRACSGATTADVANLQLGALSSATSSVTLSVGGNDAGFAAVLTECAQPAWMSNCTAAIDRAVSIIDTQLPARLSSLYGTVRTRAPQARVAVVGYPRVFSGQDCNAFTWFSATEMSRLNATADRLNSRLASAAGAAGVAFSDPTTAFAGHAVCDATEYLNGLSSPVSESYHPNRLGHSRGYAPGVGTVLTGSTTTVTSSTLQLAAAAEPELTAGARRYAELDRAVTPKVFRAPDLTTPRARAAAARAGVDLSNRASIDAADRRAEAAQG